MTQSRDLQLDLELHETLEFPVAFTVIAGNSAVPAAVKTPETHKCSFFIYFCTSLQNRECKTPFFPMYKTFIQHLRYTDSKTIATDTHKL